MPLAPCRLLFLAACARPQHERQERCAAAPQHPTWQQPPPAAIIKCTKLLPLLLLLQHKRLQASCHLLDLLCPYRDLLLPLAP